MTFHQTRPPLTAIELIRRAAVLSAANTPQTGQEGEAEPSPLETFITEPSDERQYGKMAAQIIRECLLNSMLPAFMSQALLRAWHVFVKALYDFGSYGRTLGICDATASF
jgi:hypothetical protein